MSEDLMLATPSVMRGILLLPAYSLGGRYSYHEEVDMMYYTRTSLRDTKAKWPGGGGTELIIDAPPWGLDSSFYTTTNVHFLY